MPATPSPARDAGPVAGECGVQVQPWSMQQLGEHQIRPIALGGNKWLFAARWCQQAGRGGDKPVPLGAAQRPRPDAYMRNVLERLLTQPASRITGVRRHDKLTP